MPGGSSGCAVADAAPADVTLVSAVGIVVVEFSESNSEKRVLEKSAGSRVAWGESEGWAVICFLFVFEWRLVGLPLLEGCRGSGVGGLLCRGESVALQQQAHGDCNMYVRKFYTQQLDRF
jgi:hypothetical protein